MAAGDKTVPSLKRMGSLEGNEHLFTSMDQGLTLPPKICQTTEFEDIFDYFAECERAASPIPSWFEPDASPPPSKKRCMAPDTTGPQPRSTPSPIQSFQSDIQVQAENNDFATSAPALDDPSAEDDIQLDGWDPEDLFGDMYETTPDLLANGSGSSSRQSSFDFATPSDSYSSYAQAVSAVLDCAEDTRGCVSTASQQEDVALPDKHLSVPSCRLPSLSDPSDPGATQQQQQDTLITLEHVLQRLPSVNQSSPGIKSKQPEQSTMQDVQPSFQWAGRSSTKKSLRKRKHEEPQDVTYKHSVLLSLLTRLAGPALQTSINAHVRKLQTDNVQHEVHPQLGPSFDTVRSKIQEDEVFRNEAIAYIMQLPEETGEELFGEYAVDANLREQIKDLALPDLRRMLLAQDKRMDTCSRKWHKYKSERDAAYEIINQQKRVEKWRCERESSEEGPASIRKAHSPPYASQQNTASTKRGIESSIDDTFQQATKSANLTRKLPSVAVEAAKVTQDQNRQAFEDMKTLVGIKEDRIKSLELELERVNSQLKQQTQEPVLVPNTSMDPPKPMHNFFLAQGTLPPLAQNIGRPQLSNTVSSHPAMVSVSGCGPYPYPFNATVQAGHIHSSLHNNIYQSHTSSQTPYLSPYADTSRIDTHHPFPNQYPSGTYTPSQQISQVQQTGRLPSESKRTNHQSAMQQTPYNYGQAIMSRPISQHNGSCSQGSSTNMRQLPTPALNSQGTSSYHGSPPNGNTNAAQISPVYQSRSETPTSAHRRLSASPRQTPNASPQISTASPPRKRAHPVEQDSTFTASPLKKVRREDLVRTNDVAAYQIGGRRPAWMTQPAIPPPPSRLMAQVNSTPAVVDLTHDSAENPDEDGWSDFDYDFDKALQEQEEEQEVTQEKEEEGGREGNHRGEQEHSSDMAFQLDFGELERELELEMGQAPE